MSIPGTVVKRIPVGWDFDLELGRFLLAVDDGSVRVGGLRLNQYSWLPWCLPSKRTSSSSSRPIIESQRMAAWIMIVYCISHTEFEA